MRSNIQRKLALMRATIRIEEQLQGGREIGI